MRKYKYKTGKLFLHLKTTLSQANKIGEIESSLSKIQDQISSLEQQYSAFKDINDKNLQIEKNNLYTWRSLGKKIKELQFDPQNRNLWGWGGLKEDVKNQIKILREDVNKRKEEKIENKIKYGYSEKQKIFDLKKARKIYNIKLRKLKLKKKEIIEKEKGKIIRARIAAHEGRSRHIASSVKKDLKNTELCPYCNNPLGNYPHADHIYPVSKGGQSIAYNMVMVCQECNIAKSDMTLREFIIKAGLDRSIVEERLVHCKS
jgi:DNA repair exonuclease SbcCD ATPase subunit